MSTNLTGYVKRSSLILVCAFVLPSLVIAQSRSVRPDTASVALNPYGTGIGLAIALTNSGFGFGGYYQYAVSSRSSLMAEFQLAAGKDEREEKFFSYFGNSYVPDKANYFLMLPIHVGAQRRLFVDTIEDNFRPFLQVLVGPTLGWEYPYFRDCNGNGILDQGLECEDGGVERQYDSISALFRGRSRLGAGGLLALGAHFGFSKKMTQGVRIGYAINYFFQDVHLLEPDVPDGTRRFFGSPTISLVFGRLF